MSFEEYKERVTQWILPMLQTETERQVRKFLDTGEAMGALKNAYKHNRPIGSIGHCLEMMYE